MYLRRPPRDLSSVRASIVSRTPGDGREVRAREAILEALDTLADPFDREADLVHLTGSAVVVGPRGTVLHVHKRLRRWMQPGGHLDAGEAPFDAALRESREETGLVVSHPSGGPRLIHLDVHEAADSHVHLDLRYLLLAEDADPSPPPGESGQVRWCSWDDARNLTDEVLAGALREARRQPEVQHMLRR